MASTTRFTQLQILCFVPYLTKWYCLFHELKLFKVAATGIDKESRLRVQMITNIDAEYYSLGWISCGSLG